MKYDLTNETYAPNMRTNFPGASSMSISSMLIAAIYITLLPFLADVFILSGVERVLKPQYVHRFWTVALGLILHVPIALFWHVMNTSKGGEPNLAQQTSTLLSFLVAGGVMGALRTRFRREAVKFEMPIQE
jgi:hypothetical protein